MFTIDQIRTAHAKVKSGADFPAYVRDLATLGVTRYDSFVSDGHSRYFGANGQEAFSSALYPSISIAPNADPEGFGNDLRLHQSGQTDYPRFCSDAARAGIHHWTVDLEQHTCTYFDSKGQVVLVEKLPA